MSGGADSLISTLVPCMPSVSGMETPNLTDGELDDQMVVD